MLTCISQEVSVAMLKVLDRIDLRQEQPTRCDITDLLIFSHFHMQINLVQFSSETDRSLQWWFHNQNMADCQCI